MNQPFVSLGLGGWVGGWVGEKTDLCLGANADVSTQLPISVVLLLNGKVDQGVFSKHGLGVQVRSQKG